MSFEAMPLSRGTLEASWGIKQSSEIKASQNEGMTHVTYQDLTFVLLGPRQTPKTAEDLALLLGFKGGSALNDLNKFVDQLKKLGVKEVTVNGS